MVEEVSASSSSNNEDAACDDGGGRSKEAGGRGGVVRGHVVHSTSTSTFRQFFFAPKTRKIHKM